MFRSVLWVSGWGPALENAAAARTGDAERLWFRVLVSDKVVKLATA